MLAVNTKATREALFFTKRVGPAILTRLPHHTPLEAAQRKHGGLYISHDAAHSVSGNNTPRVFLVSSSAPSQVVTSVQELISVAKPAAHGRGEETVIDSHVRRTLRVAATQCTVEWPCMPAALSLFADTVLHLPSAQHSMLHAVLHDVLVYQPGDKFLPHRDSFKMPGHIGTLSVLIPDLSVASASASSSGAAAAASTTDTADTDTTTSGGDDDGGNVRFAVADDKVETWVASRESPWAAWVGSLFHQVTERRRGVRVVAVFSLVLRADASDRLSAAEQLATEFKTTVVRGSAAAAAAFLSEQRKHKLCAAADGSKSARNLDEDDGGNNGSVSKKKSLAVCNGDGDGDDETLPGTLKTIPRWIFENFIFVRYLGCSSRAAKNLRATSRVFDEHVVRGVIGVLACFFRAADVTARLLIARVNRADAATAAADNASSSSAPDSSAQQQQRVAAATSGALDGNGCNGGIPILLPLRNLYSPGNAGAESYRVPCEHLWGADRLLNQAAALALGEHRVALVPCQISVERIADDETRQMNVPVCSYLVREFLAPDRDVGNDDPPRANASPFIGNWGWRLVRNELDCDFKLKYASFHPSVIAWATSRKTSSAWKKRKDRWGRNSQDDESERTPSAPSSDDGDDKESAKILIKTHGLSDSNSDEAEQEKAQRSKNNRVDRIEDLAQTFHNRSLVNNEPDSDSADDRDGARGQVYDSNDDDDCSCDHKDEDADDDAETTRPRYRESDWVKEQRKAVREWKRTVRELHRDPLLRIACRGQTNALWGNQASFKISWYRHCSMIFVVGVNEQQQSAAIDWSKVMGPADLEHAIPGVELHRAKGVPAGIADYW